MAILVSGGINSSQIKGKVGNNVFKRANKQTVISIYQPKVRNPRTPAQRLVRSKFVEVTNGSRKLYNRAFRKYGIKLKGHSAYSSINKMNFNNPVVKSVGYADSFLPKFPTDNQKLIGVNNDLTNEVVNYLAMRWLRQGTSDILVFGFSIPKGMFNYVGGGEPGTLYIGTNLSIASLDLEVLVSGIYLTTVKSSVQFSVNERYSFDNDTKGIAPAKEDIGGFYKYIIKVTSTMNLANDPANSDNYFISIFDVIDAKTVGGAIQVPSVECYWPNVQKAARVGAVMLLFSEGQESDGLTGEGSGDYSSFYSRELVIAVNDFSERYPLT